MNTKKRSKETSLNFWSYLKGEIREWWKSRNRMDDDSEHETLEDSLV